MKRNIILIIAMPILLCVNSCVNNYARSDIKHFISNVVSYYENNDLGIMGISDIKYFTKDKYSRDTVEYIFRRKGLKKFEAYELSTKNIFYSINDTISFNINQKTKNITKTNIKLGVENRWTRSIKHSAFKLIYKPQNFFDLLDSTKTEAIYMSEEKGTTEIKVEYKLKGMDILEASSVYKFKNMRLISIKSKALIKDMEQFANINLSYGLQPNFKSDHIDTTQYQVFNKHSHPKLPIGKKVDPMSFKDINGREIDLFSKERNYLLYFWYIGCLPCRKSSPIISDFVNQYDNHNLTIVSVNPVDSIMDIKAYLNSNNLYFTTIQGSSNLLESLYIYGFPKTLLFEENMLVYRRNGYNQDMHSKVKEKIDNLIY